MPLDATGFELTDKQKAVRAVFTCAARYFLVYGGSRSGTTFFICYAIVTRAPMAPGSRHIIFRNDGVDAKQSVGNETIPKVVELDDRGISAVHPVHQQHSKSRCGAWYRSFLLRLR